MFYPYKKRLTRTRMLTLCLALLGGLALAQWFCAQQRAGEAVRQGTLRLHIRAASDSLFDQSCKLAVRDALLAQTERLFAGAESREEALTAAARSLPALQRTAEQALARRGADEPVRVSLVEMYFPTRRYDGGVLPAGRYNALRVDIGPAAGRNWWCVLYPGLCSAACGGYDEPAAQELVCGEYVLRLRAVEWWQGVTAERGEVALLAP